MSTGHPPRVQQLADDLRRLGVAAGDTVMVHASLRRLQATAGEVCAALDAAVGASGTVLMTLGARDDWSWVNQRPEPERPALLADAEPFDPLTTPADPDVGVLAEIFRVTPGTLVSDHPEGRFGARGRLARWLTTDVPWDHYYGPGSPLARLVQVQGRVLRLGADPDTVTLTHHAEYLAEVPGKRRVRRHRRVARAGGPVILVVSCLDDSDGIVEPEAGATDYFIEILSDYLATGRVQAGRVGGADGELLDAVDYVGFATRWLEDRFGGSGDLPEPGPASVP